MEQLLIMALALNNVPFVRLLIEYGVSIRSLLTKEVLEILYGYRWHDRPTALKVEELKPQEVPDSNLNEDRKSFFEKLNLCMEFNSISENGKKIKFIQLDDIKKHVQDNLLSCVPVSYTKNLFKENSETSGFEHPYHQLFIWAVFNNMRDMALYMWEFTDEPLAASLLGKDFFFFVLMYYLLIYRSLIRMHQIP